MKLENPVILIGGTPLACGITKMLSAGSCMPIMGSFDLGFSLTAPVTLDMQSFVKDAGGGYRQRHSQLN